MRNLCLFHQVSGSELVRNCDEIFRSLLKLSLWQASNVETLSTFVDAVR